MSDEEINDDWMTPDEEDAPKELTERQKERLRRRAMNVCLYWLGQADQTRSKMEEKLIKKEIPSDIIEETLAKLEEDNYINDERYAENFVESRAKYRLQGRTAIKFDMIRKGIDKDMAEEAVQSLDVEDEEENARTLVQKKVKSTRGLDRQKRTNRLVGMLARKGYSPSLAYRLVKEGIDEDLALETEESDNLEEE